MVITSKDVDDIRQLAHDRDIHALSGITVDCCTLGAVLELACHVAGAPRGNTLTPVANQWAEQYRPLSVAFNAATGHPTPVPHDQMWKAKRYEFLGIASAGILNSNDYHLFESRFRKSLTENGFGSNLASAITGALREMADNIEQHSGNSISEPALGLVGYHVALRRMAFAVGDVGRGVLASLKDNPRWNHLADSRDALRAVVREGASRRVNMGTGEGFKQLFKSLADLNGCLRFRSVEGCLTLIGQVDTRNSELGYCHPSAGLQLSVTCSLGENEGEFPLENNCLLTHKNE